MFLFDPIKYSEMCIQYQFCEKICEYLNNRREEEGRGEYDENDIIVRIYCDTIFLKYIKKECFKINENQNNINLEDKSNDKNDISDRAKRLRRAKIRKKLVDEKPVFITESQDNPIIYHDVEVKDINNNFTSDSMVIDRIVLRSPRKNFNLNKIKELPKSGAYSVLSKGEFMFINIDYEIIRKYLPIYSSLWDVLSKLNDKNFFSDNISEIFGKVNNEEEKNSAIKQLFNENNKFYLWGFETAFDFLDKTANDLIKVSNFRRYDKKVSKTGLPTYYSKENKDNSLVIIYDRKEKLRKQGVFIENENLTRFEIKYYGTYMDAPTFQPDLSNWLNGKPIDLSFNNSQKIALALRHAAFGENNFIKMQNYIADKSQFHLLNWILEYAFPDINW